MLAARVRGGCDSRGALEKASEVGLVVEAAGCGDTHGRNARAEQSTRVLNSNAPPIARGGHADVEGEEPTEVGRAQLDGRGELLEREVVSPVLADVASRSSNGSMITPDAGRL